ncbi:MAG: universal stress protein [Desulfobacterales bacterium]
MKILVAMDGTNLEKFLLGSVALQTVSHAPCSVLVVK